MFASCPQLLTQPWKQLFNVAAGQGRGSLLHVLNAYTITIVLWGVLTEATKIGDIIDARQNSDKIQDIHLLLLEGRLYHKQLHSIQSPLTYQEPEKWSLLSPPAFQGAYWNSAQRRVCSKKRHGTSNRSRSKTLPVAHFPMHHQDGHRGRCHLCNTNTNGRKQKRLMVLPHGSAKSARNGFAIVENHLQTVS